MSRILLVEDDPILGRGLVVNLELKGHKVAWAKNLQSAIETKESQEFDLMLLDLGLPDGNGLSFCANIRKEGSRIPIVILTAQTDEESVVKGLQSGANDYVRKPFGNQELMARINTALRGPFVREDQMNYADLLIHLGQRKVLASGKEISLNRREFDILAFLIQRADAVVTRETLLAALDKEEEINDRTIDSHVSHLRAKFRNAEVTSVQITSIYGVGYRLEKK